MSRLNEERGRRTATNDVGSHPHAMPQSYPRDRSVASRDKTRPLPATAFLASSFSPPPPPAPRRGVPQPRSSTAGGENAPPAHVLAGRRASPQTVKRNEEVACARGPREGRTHFGAVAAAAPQSSAASSSRGGEGWDVAPFFSPPAAAQLARRASSPSTGTPDGSAEREGNAQNLNTVDRSGGVELGSSGGLRRRSNTSAASGSSGTATGTYGNSTINEHSSNPADAAFGATAAGSATSTTAHSAGASIIPNANNNGTNTTTMTASSDGPTRHLQPLTNHSRVNLFVRDLPLDLREDQLRAMFAAYGEIVNSAVMRNIHTGVSLGTAFVRFAQHTEAMKAMEAFAGGRAMAGSKRVTVQWARREHDKAPAGDERRRMRKLFIRNVPRDVTQEMLLQLFSPFGPVKSVSTHRDTAAANAVSQLGSSNGAAQDMVEQALDLSMSAGSLMLTTGTSGSNNATNDDRRIAFVTFDVEGVAEQATAAVHNTMPFASCNGIPLMVKLAEDTPVRHGTATGTHQNSSQNNNGNNNNGNFSSIGPLNSTASATLSTGNVAAPFSINGQTSSHTLTWGDFPTNEYLHSPSMSPFATHLSPNPTVPVTLSGSSRVPSAPAWRGSTSHTSNTNHNSNSSTQGNASPSSFHYSPRGSISGTTAAAAAVPSLSAPRSFGVGSAMGLNAPSPSTQSFASVTPTHSSTTMAPYGRASLRQQPPAQGTSTLAPPQSAQLPGGPSNPLSVEAANPQQQQQQSSSSPHAAFSNPNGALGAQASLQDFSSLGYMASRGDMYTLQPTQSASPELMNLASGGGGTGMNSFEPHDYYTLSSTFSTRAMGGLTPVQHPTSQSPPQQQQTANGGGGSGAPAAGFLGSTDRSVHNTSSSSCATPHPPMPSPGTFSFLTTTPCLGQPASRQPATSTMQAPASAASTFSEFTLHDQHQQQQALQHGSHPSTGTAVTPPSSLVPPAPRSVAMAAAAAAAAAVAASSGSTTRYTATPTEVARRGLGDDGVGRSGVPGGALSAARSDLVPGHLNRASRRAAALHSNGIHTSRSSGAAPSPSPANPELASSFSSIITRRYQPYEVTGVFGSGGLYNTGGDTGDGEGGVGVGVGVASSAAAPVGPASLRAAPPTHPASLPLPPSGAPAALARQDVLLHGSNGGGGEMLSAIAAAAASPTPVDLPLEPTLAPFDYGGYIEGDGDEPHSLCTSSYAAEVLRAVTGSDPNHSSIASSPLTKAAAEPHRTRRRSLTSPSGLFTQRESSDGDGRSSEPSSSSSPRTGTRGGGSRTSKPRSLTLGVSALLDEQMLYVWDGAPASVTGASETPSPAGAIGSQAPSPVSASNAQKNRNVLTLLPPPPSTSLVQSAAGPGVTDAAPSTSAMWITSDASAYWGAAQMKDPLRLLPDPMTSLAAAPAGVTGVRTSPQVSPTSRKSPADSSRRSTARTLPGAGIPFPLPKNEDGEDDDEEGAEWGAYPDLTLNISWDAGAPAGGHRRGHESAPYSQGMGEDVERLYNFMSYDDTSF